MGISMISMIAILGTMLLNQKITVGSKYQRGIFYSTLLLTISYAIIYWLKIFDLYIVPLSDLLIIGVIILSMEKVQKAFMRSIRIFSLTKDIILFLGIFSLILGIIIRILFCRDEGLYDEPTSPFFNYNY